jgi:atypical dual specificity phosphatase
MTPNSKPAGPAGGLSFLDPRGDALPRPHGNTYWLWAGHVLAGEHPAKDGDDQLPEKLQLFALAGITHFIDLTSAADPVKPYRALGGAVRINHPITDFGVPSPTANAKHFAKHSICTQPRWQGVCALQRWHWQNRHCGRYMAH